MKPLCRLSRREIAAYAVVNRLDYIVEECPMAKAPKMILYKGVLNPAGNWIAGDQAALLLGFLDKQGQT